MAKNKSVSIVIPCYNEEKNINRMFDELLDFIKTRSSEFEIIAVNDGSTDDTWNVISKYAKKHKEIKGINLMGNFGQSCAYQAGFDLSKGEHILTINADLETSTSHLSKVIKYLNEGYDFVNTNRVGRWGKVQRKISSAGANTIASWISGIKIKDLGSGMKGFRRVIIENIKLYGEMHRFLPALAHLYGAKTIEFDVDFKDRDYGESYYKGHKRTIKVALDFVTLAFLLRFAKKPFSAMPGRLFGFTGAIVTGLGGLACLYLFVLKLMGQSIGGRPLLILAVLLVIVGVQSMMMGMIGELLMRTYFESSSRTTYVIREIV